MPATNHDIELDKTLNRRGSRIFEKGVEDSQLTTPINMSDILMWCVRVCVRARHKCSLASYLGNSVANR